MKKHLLLGSALVAAISAFPQAPSLRQRQTPVASMTERMAKKFEIMNNMESKALANGPSSSQTIPQVDEPTIDLRTNNPIGAVNWNNFTGSMNMFGVLVSTSRPLQYDDELNAVTFVHRKSATYVPSPVPTSVGANTGVLVAMVSQNWGQSWDSTMIYNDNNNWARYPQGGILKGANATSPTNTNIANAYIVATAPITQANTALGWIGDIVTTKALGPLTYNNIQAQSSQTFIANTPPYANPWAGSANNDTKVDFLRHDFTPTDDGKIRALGQIFGGNANTPATQDFRGARMLTGSYVSGNLLFRTDSIIPDVRLNSVTGDKLIAATQGMAWNESGTVGYIYFIGAHTQLQTGVSTSASNAGFQPIVGKTTDGGLLWTWTAIDFNLPAFKAPVLDHVVSTRADTTLTIPFFAYWEGMSAVVDSAGALHLASMIVHSPAADPDSVNYFSRFNNYDGEQYHWAHQKGLRPYLYDFTYGSTGWKVKMIDSLATEGPGTRPADDGYTPNPWLPDVDGNKIDVDARIQLSRTPDGKNIVYTWAETDTVGTTNQLGYTKWNIFPNVKARLLDVATGLLSPTEVNMTKLPGTGGTTKVANSAYNHYISSKCGYDLSLSSPGSVVINMPTTVTFNAVLDPAAPATHRYASVPIEFQRVVGIGVNKLNNIANSYIYPNPANGSAFLAIDLKNNSDVKINVLNMVGQIVKTSESKAQIGANKINIDLNGLAKGVYLVNVTTDNATATQKLIVE